MQNLSELKTSALCKSKKKVFIFGLHLQIFKVESGITKWYTILQNVDMKILFNTIQN